MRTLPRRAWCSLKSISMSPMRHHVGGRLGRAGAGAPQHGAHARQQLGDRERLGDVVVGAQLEAEHLVGFGRAGGQHDDRRRDRARPQVAAHVEAVLLRQHHVEDHQVGRERAGLLQPLVAVGGGFDLVALELEVVAQPEPHLRLVFNHQDSFHRQDSLAYQNASRGVSPRSGRSRTAVLATCAEVGSAFSPGMGKCSVKVLPCCGSLLTRTKPPCPRMV